MRSGFIMIATTNLFMLLSSVMIAQNTTLNKNNSNIPTKMNHSKEEYLGHQVFVSFQKKDETLWVKLFPTDEEFKEILQLMLTQKMDDLTQEKIDEMMAHRKEEAAAVYQSEFDNFLKQADSIGVDWKTAVYEKFDFLPYLPTDFPRKYLDGDIWCSCKKLHFVIEGVEAIETPSGFKLQSIKDIRQVDDGD